jgi:hypothetical protein
MKTKKEIKAIVTNAAARNAALARMTADECISQINAEWANGKLKRFEAEGILENIERNREPINNKARMGASK